MNGDCASRARRRAISVLPTPVGPIIRMFFGATSSARSGVSFWRRVRLRSAMATARFALCCPTTYLSSSATICRGVSASAESCIRSGKVIGIGSELLDHDVRVRVDADAGRNRHGFLCDRARVERAVTCQSAGCGYGVWAARPDPDNPVIRFDEVAGAGEQEQLFAIHDDEHRLQATEGAIGPPVLGELDGRTLQLPPVLLQFRFEAREQGE